MSLFKLTELLNHKDLAIIETSKISVAVREYYRNGFLWNWQVRNDVWLNLKPGNIEISDRIGQAIGETVKEGGLSFSNSKEEELVLEYLLNGCGSNGVEYLRRARIIETLRTAENIFYGIKNNRNEETLAAFYYALFGFVDPLYAEQISENALWFGSFSFGYSLVWHKPNDFYEENMGSIRWNILMDIFLSFEPGFQKIFFGYLKKAEQASGLPTASLLFSQLPFLDERGIEASQRLSPLL